MRYSYLENPIRAYPRFFILINSLIKSLNPKLKTFLTDINLLKTFNTYTNVINKWYNNILRLMPMSAP